MIILHHNSHGMQFFYLIFIIFVITGSVFSQNNYPQEDFISPIDFTIKLSGTFGEIRSDHFHSGIDIKTEELIGKNIYAIADGFISRIKIKPGGYGKALYIEHPNGYTSVYGHLDEFNNAIGDFAKALQYENKSYDLDVYLKPDVLPVLQGEVIALSGNTGYSGGPHLHFEIRETNQQKPVNPLLFGYDVEDNTPPFLGSIKIYPFVVADTAVYSYDGQIYQIKYLNNQYQLMDPMPLKVPSSFFLGLNTFDPFNSWKNKNGVYEVQLFLDDSLIYQHKLEKFSFEETRYINALIDYPEKISNKRTFQTIYQQPNNRLSIYKQVKNRGVIILDDTLSHKLRYVITDIRGNMSVLDFTVIRSEKLSVNNSFISETDYFFPYDEENIFDSIGFSIKIPAFSLYNNINFDYHYEENQEFPYGLHHCHHETTPLQRWSELKINLDPVPAEYWDKSYIAKVEKKEKDAIIGRIVGNSILADIREFGDFTVLIDTIAPIITPFNTDDLKMGNRFIIKVVDEGSGVKSYIPTFNDQWVLMEYDAKNDLLIYRKDEHLPEGNVKFELIVTDMLGNETSWTTTFTN